MERTPEEIEYMVWKNLLTVAYREQGIEINGIHRVDEPGVMQPKDGHKPVEMQSVLI